MSATSQPTNLSEKIAQICLGLKPFQALEYDPVTNTVSIVTECLVPSKAVDQISLIITSRRDDEKVMVRRYADKFKITFVRSIKLQQG
ncbi:MAG: hypothetical protein ACOYNY_34080 [Caldilineaceae bacterium]|jgi:hypothetical protein|nr:hypothetical protein [Caldilinea sp. CFX5]